jgi:cell division protein FtsW (lipid II flippase)
VRLGSLFPLLILVLGANLCYSAAYVVDISVQRSSWGAAWRRWRWVLWLAGLLFAVLLANYWIADEIYPSLGPRG